MTTSFPSPSPFHRPLLTAKPWLISFAYVLCCLFFFPGYCEGPKCEGETNGNELSGFQCGCIRIGMGKSLIQVVWYMVKDKPKRNIFQTCIFPLESFQWDNTNTCKNTSTNCASRLPSGNLSDLKPKLATLNQNTPWISWVEWNTCRKPWIYIDS